MKSLSYLCRIMRCVIVSLSFFYFSTYAQQPGGTEFHIPFSDEIVTPHVKWAKPYVLGKTKVLFVPSIAAGRTVIELAQRFDLDYETVCIDEDWSINHWSYNLNYRRVARHGLSAFKQPYSYLLKALQEDVYDVMVLPSVRGWNEIPSELRLLIMERVRDGMGLILIHPYEGHYPETQFLYENLQTHNTMYKNMKVLPEAENIVPGALWSLSPLINCPNNPLSHKGHVIINKSALRNGTWKKAADHFIVNSVPLDFYSYKYMKYYKYTVGPSSQVLIESDSGDPICAVRTHGKGRVVAFGFFNYGMIPLVDKTSYETGQGGHYWEYYYLLLGRSLLWAAKKETQYDIDLDQLTADIYKGEPLKIKGLRSPYKGLPAGSTVRAVIRNEWGEIEQVVPSVKAKQLSRKRSDGKHIVDVFIEKGGKIIASGSRTLVSDQSIEITGIVLERSEYGDPDVVRGHVSFSPTDPGGGTAVVELMDNWDRIISRKETIINKSGTVPFDFKIDKFLTHVGWIHCIVSDASGVVQDEKKKSFWATASMLGNWDDFMIDMRWSTYVPIVYPWQKARDEALRRMRVNLIDDPYTNFEISYRAPRNWGRDPEGELYLGWEEQDGPNANSLQWLEKSEGYRITRDKSYLVREPCLSDPEYQEKIIPVLKKIATEFKRYNTTWYDLGNEQSLLSGIPPLDFCFSKYCLAAFREYLKKEYGSLDALNVEWETNYKRWEDVMPQTVDEVRKTGNFPPWTDHRRYMQVMWAGRIKQFGDVVRAIDPGARVCLTNVRRSNPHIGVDYYLQERAMECIRPGETYYHQDFQPGILTFGGSAYANTGEQLKSRFLPGVIDGQAGTSAWWYYTCFNPDLTPSQSGEELTDYYLLVRSGLGKLMMTVQRVNQPVAMHYSMPSMNAAWIIDGKLFEQRGSANFARHYSNRSMWDRILSDLGLQYSWLAHEQVEQGDLKLSRFKVFILPNSIAISKQEAEEIRRFVRSGGILIADAQPGMMDEHAKWQNPGRLDDLFGTSTADAQLESGIVLNKFGQGSAVLLNQFVTDYAKDHGLGERISEILINAGITAPAKVLTRDGKQLTDCETHYYRHGDGQYIGIVRSVVENKEPVTVTIELPAKSAVYESTTGKFLGNTDRIDDKLISSDIRMFSMLPEEVNRWDLTLHNSRAKQGEVLKYTLKRIPYSSRDITHVMHIEIIYPDGSICWHYSGNVLATAKTGYTGSIPLALNEAKGKWRIKVTDFITGKQVEKTFIVE